MNGWIDKKKERGLVNKHLRADKLPTGRGTERQREREALSETEIKKIFKNVGERDKKDIKAFHLEEQKIRKSYSPKHSKRRMNAN